MGTQSAQGQLLAGIRQALAPLVTQGILANDTTIAPADNIRTQYPTEDLVAVVQSNNLSIFPFIAIVLGAEKIATQQQAGIGAYGRRVLAVNNAAPSLVQVDVWQCPLTLVIVAAGDDGMFRADGVRGAVKEQLRRAARWKPPPTGTPPPTNTPSLSIPLPDDLETANTVPGPVYGLAATLYDLGARPDDRLAAHLIYEIDLQYTAVYGEYRSEAVSLATGGIAPDMQVGLDVKVTLPALPMPPYP